VRSSPESSCSAMVKREKGTTYGQRGMGTPHCSAPRFCTTGNEAPQPAPSHSPAPIAALVSWWRLPSSATRRVVGWVESHLKPMRDREEWRATHQLARQPRAVRLTGARVAAMGRRPTRTRRRGRREEGAPYGDLAKSRIPGIAVGVLCLRQHDPGNIPIGRSQALTLACKIGYGVSAL
jgi:hypothetical protein